MIAAVDLGSNSFHMIVARVADGDIHVVDRLRETVRLAAGLDEQGRLVGPAVERALACLERFGQRVRELPQGAVRAVGTNTLRKARNGMAFLEQAREALGHPIDIISGVEEARLIYLGVAHSLGADDRRRLVVDIGGGSTELIIGRGFEPRHMESLYMGCVSSTQRFFGDGGITAEGWRRAVIAARLELRPVARSYRILGWDLSVGASGTALAIARCLRASGWSADGITLEGLRRLRKAMIKAGSIKRLDLPGIGKDRAQVFPGGVAVMQAVFEGLGIEQMTVSDGALREGLLYDHLGRIRHEEIRPRTMQSLQRRFALDAAHGHRVAEAAAMLFAQAAEPWGLGEEDANLLQWAARVHELGLAIAHSGHHKHGAYILAYADLPGFTRQEQQVLAALVRTHRRKFVQEPFAALPEYRREAVRRLALLLRLAVLLNRGRPAQPIPPLRAEYTQETIRLEFPEGYLEAHPMTEADLVNERAYLKAVGFKLRFS